MEPNPLYFRCMSRSVLLGEVADPARFERATCRLGGGCSIQLSYGSVPRDQPARPGAGTHSMILDRPGPSYAWYIGNPGASQTLLACSRWRSPCVANSRQPSIRL